MKRLMLTISLVVLANLAVHAQSPIVPPLINYQGRLTDAQGKGLKGTRKLEFNIYNTKLIDPRVKPIWGPQTYSAVILVDGYFNIILGPKDESSQKRAITDALVTSIASGRYLGIKVNDGPEISPRQLLLSSPYAIQAEEAKHAQSATSAGIALHHSNKIPLGTIVAYYGEKAPSGWLMCDNEPIPAGSEYDALREMVRNNKTPDLRGMFLRGAGQNSDSNYHYSGDKGHTLGSYQGDQIARHRHAERVPDGDSGTEVDVFDAGSNDSLYSESASTGYFGGDETRPNNRAVNFIIKY